MAWNQHDARSRSPKNTEWVSRAVVRLLRYSDKRPAGLQMTSDGSVLVSSLIEVWGAQHGLTAEDVLNVVYKNMDNNRGTKRFEVTQLPNGDTAIAAAARDGGGGGNAWGSSGGKANGWSQDAGGGSGGSGGGGAGSWAAKSDWKSGAANSWQDAKADTWKDAGKDAWSDKKKDSGNDWKDWKGKDASTDNNWKKDDSGKDTWKAQDWKASSSSSTSKAADAWKEASWGEAKSSWKEKGAAAASDSAGKWGSANSSTDGGLWPNGEKITRWISYMLRQPHIEKAGGWMDIDELLEAVAKEKPNFNLTSKEDLEAMLKESDHDNRFEVDSANNTLRKVPRNERGQSGGGGGGGSSGSNKYWGNESSASKAWGIEGQKSSKAWGNETSNSSKSWFSETSRSSKPATRYEYPPFPKPSDEPTEAPADGVWAVEEEEDVTGAYNPEDWEGDEEEKKPSPPPGEGWTQYEDKGTFWWFYDGPLGQWWLSSETEKSVQKWVV